MCQKQNMEALLEKEAADLTAALDEHVKRIRELRHLIADGEEAITAYKDEIKMLETRVHVMTGGRNVVEALQKKLKEDPPAN